MQFKTFQLLNIAIELMVLNLSSHLKRTDRQLFVWYYGRQTAVSGTSGQLPQRCEFKRVRAIIVC